MKNFWDERYAEEVYAYGTKPNEFLRKQLEILSPGKILFPAEGEGRNAVYAASLGFDVFAFDFSQTGRKKAMDLAKTLGVSINYKLSSFDEIEYPNESFDVVVLIFAHMPPDKRREWHRKFISFLKPGGKILLQGFAKDQINNNSGGPKSLPMLFSETELLDDFNSMVCEIMHEEIIVLNEGEYHLGEASVINAVFVKPVTKSK